jgi:hypothetical protein
MNYLSDKRIMYGGIAGLVVLLVVGILVFGAKNEDLNSTQSPSNLSPVIEKNGEVVELSSVPVEDRDNRYRLLLAMTRDDQAYYENSQTYTLDDNDPTSKVIIGTYQADAFGENGGIVMLKPIEDGRYNLYWEIKSPMFWHLPFPNKEVRDINNDGLKELITSWQGGLASNTDPYHAEYWVLTLDSKNKRYKVLNEVVLEDGTPAKNFSLEQPDKNEIFLNRFQANSSNSFASLVQDVDNDAISEIIINDPALEHFNILKPSDAMRGEPAYSQIYKWNGTHYSLWREQEELLHAAQQ